MKVDPADLAFFATSEIVVVGHDPERADYDNPRGDIHAEAWYVWAEDSQGYRWSSRCLGHGTFGRESEAQRNAEMLACGLNARAQLLHKLPIGFEQQWQPIDPCYGSAAYEREGVEADRAFVERMEAM